MAVVNGTKGNDTIFIDAGNDIIKSGNGNDYIWAGSGNDKITGGKDSNIIDFNPLPIPGFSASFGHDVVNLTKGEKLTLDCSAKNDFKADIVGKDVVITFPNNTDDSITLKNFASKDVVSSKGSVELKIANPNPTSANDTYLTIDLKTYLYDGGAFSSKGVYSGKWLSEKIDGSYLNSREKGFGKKGIDGVTVKAGAGDDEITGSKFNDKITGGVGDNTINVSLNGKFGDDTVVLTKNENLVINVANAGQYGANFLKQYATTVEGKDFIVKFYAEPRDAESGAFNEESYLGSIRFKDFASKNVVGENGSVVINIPEFNTSFNLTDEIFTIAGVNDTRSKMVLYSNDEGITSWVKKGTINGTRLGEDFWAADITEGYGKKGTKGVTINAGGGDDRATGSNFADKINGGDGDDTINGGDGNDEIEGGKGKDTIYGGYGNDELEGDDGNDTIYGGDDNDEIEGGKGDDTIYGGDGNDEIEGGKGNDYIEGNKGSDTIYGGDGNDTIYASQVKNPALDYVYGNIVDDGSTNKLDGGAGDDIIYSSLGADKIYGGKGNDILEVFGANSVTYGGDGNDEITLYYNSAKTVHGEKGNDFISIEYGQVEVYGGAGNDILESGLINNSNLYFNKGDGNDLYRYRGALEYDSGQGDGYNVSEDTLVFKNVSASDLSFKQSGEDLVISYGKKDSVTVENYYKYLNAEDLSFEDERGNTGKYMAQSGDWKIYIQTKDGGKELLSDVLAAETGSSKSDKIESTSGGLYLTGDGNDTINVSGANAIIYAGAGKDNITATGNYSEVHGGKGNDTINTMRYTPDNLVFDNGDGHDVVKQLYDDLPQQFAKTATDKINLTGVDKDGFACNINGDDLVISYNPNKKGKYQDSVTIKNYLTDKDNSRDIIIVTKDGVETAVKDILYNITGKSSKNNTIESTILKENIIGGSKTDTVVFKANGNHDIYEYVAGADTLVFDGIDSANISYTKTGDDLVITYDENSSVTIKDLYAGNNFVNWNLSIQTADGEKELLANAILKANTPEGAIAGTIGNDKIVTSAANEIIYGYQGDDILEASGAGSIVYGGEGNDVITASGAISEVNGGAGDDVINTQRYTADNLVFGKGDGHDVIYQLPDSLPPEFATTKTDYIKFTDTSSALNLGYKQVDNDLIITRNSAKDSVTIKDYYAEGIERNIILVDKSGRETELSKLLATENADFVLGSNADDTINALAGNDTVYALEGNDTIDGGDGDDRLYGQAGDDNINGGAGKDNISGGTGDDIIYGGDEKDTLNGGDGKDIIYGGAGDDLIGNSNSEAGDDEFHGGDGIDTIYGGAGNDKIYGDAGNDKIYGNAGDDFIYGGDGNDLIYTESNSNDKATGNNYVEGGAGDDNVYGGAGNDIIYLGEGNNDASGYDGDDKIYGGSGNDDIYTGHGNNYVETGDGTDYAICGSGNDEIILGAGTKTVTSAKGDDIITLTKSISETKVSVKDSEGNDVINLADNKDNVNVVFNIDTEGNMDYDGVRLIADADVASWKTNFSTIGGIKITTDSTDIETIKTVDGYQITATDINELKADVVSWLTNPENNFADVETALKSGTEDQVDALMAIFETANWQQIV